MPILVKQGKSFTPCPQGAFPAVCCDVIDVGEVKTSYGGKERIQHKITIVWQVDETSETGERYTVRRRYTASLDPKASLRKDLESWRGKPFTFDELAGFDLEKLLNAPAMINVMHQDRDGETYANVQSIMPLPKGMHRISVVNYVRAKDRAPEQAGAPEPPPFPDDETPF